MLKRIREKNLKQFINKIKPSFIIKKIQKVVGKIKSSAIVKNDGKNFLHFFLAFTIIFVTLTIIILQVMHSGIYRTTDQNLENLAESPTSLTAAFRQSTLGSPPENNGNNNNQSSANQPPQNSQELRGYSPTAVAIVRDPNGDVVYPPTGYANVTVQQLEKSIKFSSSSVDSFRTAVVKNPYGENWQFRYLTIKTKFQYETNRTETVYAQLFINVDQLQTFWKSSMLTIVTTMAIFWLLSMIISLYLANWSLRPIMAAFEKQKAFVENASHELRTPLAILQNRLELLFQKPTATIIDESENISESLAEVRNMRLLTTNLLDLARRDSNIRIEAETTGVDFFEGIFDSYQMLAENAGKQFDSSVKFDGKIKLDQSLIKQLLTILFDNALKYTNEDGQIQITIQKTGPNLVLTVADNGEGISDEDKKKIFDRFFRVDKARTRQKGGLGLGLSLAKQIVDAYNGKISVEDNSPKGTKFVVKFRVDSPIVNPAKIFQKL